MKKYYRRLTWGLSILLTVIALVTMVLLTVKKAEAIQDDAFGMIESSVEAEREAFLAAMYPSAEEARAREPEEERKRAIEAASSAAAVDYYHSGFKAFSYTRGGYYNDLFIGGKRVSTNKTFLVLFESENNPMYAVLPESFWTMPEVTGARMNPMDLLRQPLQVRGKCCRNIVYIDTLEICLEDIGENGPVRRYIALDLVYDPTEIPGKAEMYRFTSTGFDDSSNSGYLKRAYPLDLDATRHDPDRNEAEEKMRKEASELLDRAPDMDNIQAGESCRNYGLVTSYLISGVKMKQGDSYYVFCYIFHPLANAMEELTGVYIAVVCILAFALAVLILLVRSLRKNQERYERSRLAMTRAVAHELKTPLAVTKSYVDNWSDIDESRREEYRKDMSEQIDYVNGLVGDLLELSRMEMKSKELNREPVNLAELNDMILGKLSALTADREITVNKPEDTESLTVQADLGMMRTVLMNLVTNAIRYGEKTVVIDISKKRDAVRYQITNDGNPIPADQLDLIWDEFYMVAASGAAKDSGAAREGAVSGTVREGSGLGLAITRRILELHGAKYGCTSDEKGTVVYFEL